MVEFYSRPILLLGVRVKKDICHWTKFNFTIVTDMSINLGSWISSPLAESPNALCRKANLFRRIQTKFSSQKHQQAHYPLTWISKQSFRIPSIFCIKHMLDDVFNYCCALCVSALYMYGNNSRNTLQIEYAFRLLYIMPMCSSEEGSVLSTFVEHIMGAHQHIQRHVPSSTKRIHLHLCFKYAVRIYQNQEGRGAILSLPKLRFDDWFGAPRWYVIWRIDES